MSKLIYVVDDESNIRTMMQLFLENEGFTVETFKDGQEACQAFSAKEPDMLILDIMMPGIDGLSLCTYFRRQSHVPIIFVSAKDTPLDRVMGITLGSDDYITKPFRPLVLGAKVKALIRRTKNMGNHSDIIQCGPFSYESSTMRFYKDGEELILSSKESALLLLFIKHPGQVFTKDMIYEQVWGTTVAIDDNAIMVYINRLRSKIEKDRQKPEHIITVRGMGYRFLP